MLLVLPWVVFAVVVCVVSVFISGMAYNSVLQRQRADFSQHVDDLIYGRKDMRPTHLRVPRAQVTPLPGPIAAPMSTSSTTMSRVSRAMLR